MIKKIAEMYSGVDLNKEEEEFANGEKVADNGETLFDFDEEEEVTLSDEEKVLSDGDINDFVRSQSDENSNEFSDQSDVLDKILMAKNQMSNKMEICRIKVRFRQVKIRQLKFHQLKNIIFY